MESVYEIYVNDYGVIFQADGKVIFKRDGNHMTVVTRGMNAIAISSDEDFILGTFPCNRFSTEINNGRYIVKIIYSK